MNELFIKPLNVNTKNIFSSNKPNTGVVKPHATQAWASNSIKKLKKSVNYSTSTMVSNPFSTHK